MCFEKAEVRIFASTDELGSAAAQKASEIIASAINVEYAASSADHSSSFRIGMRLEEKVHPRKVF